MANFLLQTLPRTEDEALLSAISRPLRRLRLKALQTDPENWRSKYSFEVVQPPEFWINRLTDETADHFLAYDIDNQTDLTPYEAEIGGRLVACLVVRFMGKQSITVSGDGRPLGASEICDHYELSAVYVEPEYRGQRLSTRLINAAINKVCNQPQVQGQCVVFSLSVRKLNGPAVRLYRRLGFAEYGQDIERTDSGEEDTLELMRLVLGSGGTPVVSGDERVCVQ